MSTARIVTVRIPATALTTFWGLRFNTDGGSTWTDYNPSSVDIAVPTADADGNYDYTLDGINSPAPTAAAASYAGNWYQIRLKTSGGYGGWSQSFKIEYEPDDNAPLADVARLIRDMSDLRTMLDFATQEETDVFLGICLSDASDEIRESDTIAVMYGGAATAGQIRRIQRAELLLAKAYVFEKAAGMKATGMQAPLLMEESEALWATEKHYRDLAEAIIAQLETGEPIGSPFSLPAVASGTFSVSSTDRTPSERLRLWDESDDVSAFDTVNG